SEEHMAALFEGTKEIGTREALLIAHIQHLETKVYALASIMEEIASMKGGAGMVAQAALENIATPRRIGRNQPVPIDGDGRPYCRTHGSTVAPDYEEALDESYRVRRERLKRLYDFVMRDQEPPSQEEIDEVVRQWERD